MKKRPSVGVSGCQRRKSFSLCMHGGQSSDNRTIVYNETLLITILHCSIYLASKYPQKYVFLCELCY